MIVKNTSQIQLDIDSIDYRRLDHFVSGKLSGPAKLWVHGVFFHKVRSLDSHNSAKANKEFVDGANWAKNFILKAANQEVSRFGAKVKNIRFEANRSKVRITLTVNGIQNALNNAISDFGMRVSDVAIQDAYRLPDT